MSDIHGRIHWTELNTRDVAREVEFYGTMLGWTMEEVDMGGPAPYRLAKRGDEMICGILDISAPEFENVPNHWMTYFSVDDVDETAAGVAAAGGVVVRAPFDVPGVGRIAMVQDVAGAVCGVMTPASRD